MKRATLSEEQIFGALKEAETGIIISIVNYPVFLMLD